MKLQSNKAIELQMEFCKKDISQIKFDLTSKDEIPIEKARINNG